MRRSLYVTFVRPVLFRMDPENAHNLSMRVLILLSWTIGGYVRIRRFLRL